MSLAMEIQLGLSPKTMTNHRALEFLRRLKEKYDVATKAGNVQVIPSLFIRTNKLEKRAPGAKIHYGLGDFNWMAFRITPGEEEAKEYRKFLAKESRVAPYGNAIIVEIGLAKIGGMPVIVVVNAQALKQYYSLPWKLKKRFKGSYEETLGIIKEASGGLPVLVPTNEAVKKYIKGSLNHDVPDSVLNEFYDGFCSKRNYTKAEFPLQNAFGGKRITSEFWVPKK